MAVESFMSSPLVSCCLTDRVDVAMGTMIWGQNPPLLPVTDDGQLMGIVSIGDLVKHRLEEKALEANVLPDVTRMRA